MSSTRKLDNGGDKAFQSDQLTAYSECLIDKELDAFSLAEVPRKTTTISNGLTITKCL